MGGHHQNLRALAVRRRADVVANQIEPAQLGHHVVHDQDIERPLGQQPLRLARVCGVHHDVAGLAQRAAEGLHDFLFVIDEQNGAARVGH